MADPTITFGADQLFSTLTSFVHKTVDVETKRERAATNDEDGDELISILFNEMTEAMAELEAKVYASGPAIPSVIGSLLGGYLNTELEITTQNKAPVMLRVVGHNHANNAHVDNRRKATHGISLTKGFGAIDFLGGTSGSDASVKSSRCRIYCDHKDEENEDGDHLIGQNYHAMIESETVWNGVPSSAIGAGWDNPTVKTRRNNEGFLETVVTGIKAVVMA